MKVRVLPLITVFTLAFLFISSSLLAQTGKVRGKITDQTNGDVLPGSNLIFEEFSIGAAANFEGIFEIFAVPVGTHTLTVSYLGYEQKLIEVTIVENRTLELDIELTPLALEGDEVLVTAQASAQQQAINQQLTSKTIKNIVSRKQIQQLPEQNAAEAVGRLPGVSLERSGGEGSKVIIRGMAPKYSQIQIDGVTMGATGEGDRSMDMSMISPYMLEGIELTKSVMANQEATATGGIVNFRIKKAPDQFSANVMAQGGYNGLRSTYNNWKVSAGASDRFFDKAFGIYGQFDYEVADRGSHQLGGVGFAQDDEFAPVRTNTMQLMDIYRNIERIGGALVLDYQIDLTDIKLSNFYSRKNTESINYTNTYGYEQQDFTIDYLDTPERNLTILSNALQIDTEWRNWELNAILSHTLTENLMPAQIASGNNNSPDNPFPADRTSSYNINLDPETVPDSLVYTMDDVIQFMQVGDLTHEESKTREQDFAGELNLAYNFGIASDINLKLSFGGKIRHKEKEYDRTAMRAANDGGNQGYRDLVYNEFESELSQRTRDAYAANDQNILLTDFFDKDYDGTSHMGDRYDFGNVFDKDKFRRIHDLVMDTFDPNSTNPYDILQRNFINSNYFDYNGTEDYGAFYVMPEFKFGNDFLFVPGVRYESNETEYTGYRGNRVGVLREYTRTPIDTVTKRRYNDFWLPMIQLFYTPTDWMTIKAGYTQTLQRPDYNNIMPGWVIGFQGSIDNLSNFQLRPEQSTNWDLQFSFHDDKIGLVSIGGFHKEITDMIFWTGTTVITDTAYFELPSSMYRQKAAYATNNEFPATNYGFELEWQSNFWWLPGLLSGIVVNVNYTRNWSEAEYLRSQVKVIIDPITYRSTLVSEDTTYTAPMISQPDHLLNLTLGYDYKAFSIRWAMRFTSGIFKATNWYPDQRAYSTNFVRYDLSLKQGLPVDGLELFLNINNLTGEMERDIIDYNEYTRYMEDYGTNANLGIRYVF